MKVLWFVFSLLTTLFFASAGIAAGQAVQVKPDPPRASNPDPAVATPAPKLPEGVGAAVDPNKYLIGTEDILTIQTWREPDFSRTVGVRPDGKITMPLVGDIQAAGLTPQALTDDLTTRIGKFVQDPKVSVTVVQVLSKKYYIDGQVGRPGAYPLVTPTKVLEALSMAGGFREFANETHVTILRGTTPHKFNYKEVIRGKNLEQNIYLENGDHIIVK